MARLFRRSASPEDASSSAAAFKKGKDHIWSARDAVAPAEVRRGYTLALQAFQEIIDIGHPDYAVGAMMQSAFCWQNLSDDDRAEEFFHRVVEHRYPNLTPHAEIMLAYIRLRRDDTSGAIEHFQRAIEFRSPPENMDHVWFGRATAELEIIYVRIGDSAGLARVRAAVANPGRLAMNRGHALAARGDLDGAIAAYREAAGQAEYAERAVAAYKLGGLLRDRGDLLGARVAFRTAVDCGDVNVAQQAIWQLDRCQ